MYNLATNLNYGHEGGCPMIDKLNASESEQNILSIHVLVVVVNSKAKKSVRKILTDAISKPISNHLQWGTRGIYG